MHSPAPQKRDEHELVAARAFADEGADVRLTLEDHSVWGEQSIDAWVRWSPDDEGAGTELKSLVSATNPARATKRHIIKGAQQLADHVGTSNGTARGQVLIDGRQLGLGDTDAVRAWRSAVGQANQFNQVLPAKVVVLLGDERMHVFRPHRRIDPDGTTRYEPFDGDPPGPISRDHLSWSSMWRNRWEH